MKCDFGENHKGRTKRIWHNGWEQWVNACAVCEMQICTEDAAQARAATELWNSPIELPAETFDDLPMFGGPLQPEKFADSVRQA